MRELKLGVLGMSDGNGHPYSWSAIFNGYNASYMKDCPFPTIFEYLSQQKFPDDSIPNARVTHVWTQDIEITEHIARSCNIDQTVANMEDMIGQVDAVLLARDDPDNHFRMSAPFIKAGIPIFIDKPLATTVEECKAIFELQKFDWQVFSCSALRYSEQLKLSNQEKIDIGEIFHVEASVPNSWEKYAIHIVEPSVNLLGNLGAIEEINSLKGNFTTCTSVKWSCGKTANFTSLGSLNSGFNVSVYGTNGSKELRFTDSFSAFKNSLIAFVQGIREERLMIDRSETLNLINIIEKGLHE